MATTDPGSPLLQSAHEGVLALLRSTKTSQLVLMIADESIAVEVLGAVFAAVGGAFDGLPADIQDREWAWVAQAVMAELDRRIPIPGAN